MFRKYFGARMSKFTEVPQVALANFTERPGMPQPRPVSTKAVNAPAWQESGTAIEFSIPWGAEHGQEPPRGLGWQSYLLHELGS